MAVKIDKQRCECQRNVISLYTKYAVPDSPGYRSSLSSLNLSIMAKPKAKQATDGKAAGNAAKDTAAKPKKKFKLHRMTKKELLETRIPSYDYLIP